MCLTVQVVKRKFTKKICYPQKKLPFTKTDVTVRKLTQKYVEKLQFYRQKLKQENSVFLVYFSRNRLNWSLLFFSSKSDSPTEANSRVFILDENFDQKFVNEKISNFEKQAVRETMRNVPNELA